MGSGTCVVCGCTFSFNPERVPSVLVNGVKTPICRTCVERTNPERVKKGIPPIEVLPGAYDNEPVGDNSEDDLPEAPPLILTGNEVVAVFLKKREPKPKEPVTLTSAPTE